MSIPTTVPNNPLVQSEASSASTWPKRCLDLVLSLPALVALSPLFLLLMILIKLDSRGPAFFRQVRIGRHGHKFRIFKFRTMVTNAEAYGAQITVGEDKRITRVGHWLRKLKLDELPQLLNVIRGEMTLVGPRPEVPQYVARYNAEQRRILALTPGITSLASLEFRHESELLAAQADPEQFYCKQVMPAKIQIDLDYAQHANWMSDLGVIGKTVACLIRR
jgi:lipopolysaccharide/colanic/teichoic acid biosynthesis glycosyltransferase